MLRMKSDRTTASEGQWLYYADSYTYAEPNDVAGTIVNTDNITSDQYNYFWNVVKNSDGSITLQSYTGNTYWAQAKGYNNDYQPNQFPMSSTSTTFTTEANGCAFKLITICKQKYVSWGIKERDKSVYVVDNGVKGNNTARHEMGYSDASTDNGNRASIEFYAVDIVSFTYNFKYKGESQATETVSCSSTAEYPEFTTTFPAYVTAQKPVGKVTKAIAGTTVDIECVANLPFETDKYYYFSCGSDDALTRLYGSSDLTYRSTASANEQASTLNDVKSDLWYVTGDPFSGFQFHNVGKDNIAETRWIPSNTSFLGERCRLVYSGTSGENTFKLFKITDETFGIYIYSDWTIGRGNVAWHQNDANNIYFEIIDLSNTPTDAAYTFRLTEPTISIPLNASAADNNETYATTCLPYAVEVVSSEAKAYAGKFTSDSELDMVEVSAVPANQGVILKGNEGVESISLKVVRSANVIDNDLKGTTDGLSDLTNVLSFGRAGGSGKVGFYKSTNSTLRANRAYVQRNAANSVAMNFGGHTTGINAVETDNAQTANAPVYDLAGRRVSTLVKGSLYIKGGKKFIAQ